ncbi:MAG: chemotaxis protein CheW [Verrucomicrobia bacterium]|nr:chemotaxis protein CheW [Verrucomicrobiota bacterium]MBU4246823.1 chemotaxis protein CheW [Verrucomicrobiota bacterium]MBU4291817.1 chemotaxis protein CheW [Verrucomicrobiota bacterium]MBU4429419.1 chemotaxis protein CheW [Verrucomicrobiota bacterium]MCG2680816.1 chemotaxis protein CheW [Kiritimatiellia bacterium]
MLLLIFQSGEDRYGLDASRIIEVVPLASLKHVPHAPEGMAGLLNYRGTIVPVMDLSALLTGTPSRARLSTRIVLVDVSPEDSPAPRILGFMAERVTETIRYREQDLQVSGVAVPGAPYLGKIMLDQYAMVQRIDPAAVIPESLKATLFALAKESNHD